jgi:hypothetical protein
MASRIKLECVRAGRQKETNFFLMPGLVIILLDSLANLRGCDTDNRVGGGIVIRGSAEHLNAERPLFEKVALPVQRVD